MTPNLANRIGIILSFIGSLLIAPELIGYKRLSALQSWLRKNLLFLRESSQMFLRRIPAREELTFKAFSLMIIIFLIVGCSFMFIVQTEIFKPYIQSAVSNIWSIAQSSPIARIMLYWFIIWAIGGIGLYFIYELIENLTGKSPDKMVGIAIIFVAMAALPLLLSIAAIVILFFVLPYMLLYLLLVSILLLVNVSLQLVSTNSKFNALVVRFGLLLLVTGTGFQLYSTF